MARKPANRSQHDVARLRRDAVAVALRDYVPTMKIVSEFTLRYGVGDSTIQNDIAWVRAQWRKLNEPVSLAQRLEEAIEARKQLIGKCLESDSPPDRATALRAMDSLAALQGLEVDRAKPVEIKLHFPVGDSDESDGDA